MYARLRRGIVYSSIPLLLSLLPLTGEMPRLSVRSLDSRGWELSFQAIEDSRVLENINRGLTAEIIFDIRIYRTSFSFLGLRGRLPVMTKKIVAEGRWDRFNGHYTILREGGIERFSSAEDFRRRFFSLTDWHFSFLPKQKTGYSIMVRSRVLPLRLYPPFNILSPFQSLQDKRTPWVQLPLGGEL